MKTNFRTAIEVA